MTIQLGSSPITRFQPSHRQQPALQFGFFPGFPGFDGNNANSGLNPNVSKDVKPASNRHLKEVRTNGIDELNALNASKEQKPGLVKTLLGMFFGNKKTHQEASSPGKNGFLA